MSHQPAFSVIVDGVVNAKLSAAAALKLAKDATANGSKVSVLGPDNEPIEIYFLDRAVSGVR